MIEASSGSTAVSEAYFARMLGLPFIAVMPASSSTEKIAQIEFYGGTCQRLATQLCVVDPENSAFFPGWAARDPGLAAMRMLAARAGFIAGGSTGTNLWGCFRIISELRAGGIRGSVVTLLCDRGDRYSGTYYDDGWVRDEGIDLHSYESALAGFFATGQLP